MTQEEQINSISVSFTADSNDDESNQDASRVLRKLLLEFFIFFIHDYQPFIRIKECILLC